MILDDLTQIPYIHVTHNNLPNDNRFIYVFFFILLYKQNGKSSTAERKNFVVLPVGRELNVTPMSFVVWRFVRTKRERTSAHICEVRRVCSLVKLSPCVCVWEKERERESNECCAYCLRVTVAGVTLHVMEFLLLNIVISCICMSARSPAER